MTLNRMVRWQCADRPWVAKPAPHQLSNDMTSTGTLRFKLLLSTVLVVAAALTTGTAASVFVASDSARRSAQGGLPPELSLDAHRRTAAIHALQDSLLLPLGPLPALDAATLRSVVALTQHAGRPGETPAAAVWTVPPTAASDSLSSAAYVMLRRWARSAPLEALWGYREGLGDPANPWVIPGRAWPLLMRYAKHNTQEADSALVHGAPEAAMERARETIAAARHFADQPTAADMLVGRALLMDGADLLARAARQGDAPTIVSQARRLSQLAQANYALAQPERASLNAMAVDPADGRLEQIAADRSLPHAWRLAALDAVVVGACLRTREVLLGATEDRRKLLAQMGVGVADIPRAGELVPVYRRALDAFDIEGLASHLNALHRPDGGRATNRVETPMQWLVPAGVRHRYAFCRSVI